MNDVHVVKEALFKEVLELCAAADPRVVNWFGLGSAGLRARFVGGARVRMIRSSPGCGVHRRRRHRVSQRLAECARSGCALGLLEGLPVAVDMHDLLKAGVM